MQRGRVGWVNYNNCLTVHVASDGMYLLLWAPFRIGHPPLFLPWEAMHSATTRRILWVETVCVDIGSPTVARVELLRKIFDASPLTV